MSRRQSLDRQGIISPSGPFLTPSPSSIPASPRLLSSPSQSPFQQDVFLVTNSTITNTTQEQERKAATPSRRPSIHQLSSSPNAGTVVFQPSPSQSPAAATTVIGIAGNEFNTTLVGSNNISLNKKSGNKRITQSYVNYGYGPSITASSALATTNMVNVSKGSQKKAAATAAVTAIPTMMFNNVSSPITNDSPISSPNSCSIGIKPSTPQPPVLQQFPVGNHLLQFIQGSQIITTCSTASNHQRTQFTNSAPISVISQNSNSTACNVNKSTKGPQQILPKPQHSVSTNVSVDKTITIQTKPNTVQVSQSPQAQTVVNTSTAQTQGGQIILPTGNLNSQPLLLNQMPVIVQQNTPHGVQLILRPSTPQLTAPLVIHNTRPQMQQPQAQQLLRIVNTNGTMQLAAAPTFIVSSQANLIQQNLQAIKANTQNQSILQATPRSQQQQIAAAINSHLLGQSVAQLQNLHINSNLAQIQMPNGLNTSILSQLPTQFQQSLTGFNHLNQNINLASLNSTNLQQIAAAAAAAGAAFQSPPPPSLSQQQQQQQHQSNEIQMNTQNLHFSNTNQISGNVTQGLSLAVTPEPIRNTTPATTVLVQPDNNTNNIASVVKQNSIKQQQNDITDIQISKTPKKKTRKKKIQQTNNDIVNNINTQKCKTSTTSTGKLDLANVMKLCGIMEDDDYADNDIETQVQNNEEQKAVNTTHDISTNNDVTITIPGQNNDRPFTFTIPANESGIRKMDSNNINTINTTANTLTDGQNIVIKIDQNDLGSPYTISIPRMHSAGLQNSQNQQQQHNPIISQAQPFKTVSTSIVCSSSSSNIISSPSIITNTNINKSQFTPTLQSQINEIQNQLIGVSTTVVTTLPTTTTTTEATTTNKQNYLTNQNNTAITAAVKPRRKPNTKKNCKKSELIIPTTVCNVPSQIGNIQISQVDTTKIANQTTPVSNVVENKIQITPIIENKNDQRICTTKIPTNVSNNYINEQNNININNNKIQTDNNIPQRNTLALQGQNITQQPLTSPVTNIFSQLTGSLSLAFADDGGRLLLRHDANSPQDAQSQIILQAILSGALCNVTIINEPLDKNKIKTQQQNNNIVQTTIKNCSTQSFGNPIHNNKQLINNIIGSNNNTNITQNSLPTAAVQMNFSNALTNISKETLQQQVKRQIDNSSSKKLDIPTSQYQSQQQQQSQNQTAVIVDSNAPKLLALPKIDANQQLFSLNTITNEITHINPLQTTASLGPMERLLIVPAGINAQQLAQCWSQGQIHFNNIGQVPQTTTDTSSIIKTQQQQQQINQNNQLIQQQQQQPQQPLQQIQQIKQIANVAPIIDASKARFESKPKKSKPRKQKCNENVNKISKPIQKTNNNMTTTAKLNTNPIQIVQPNIANKERINFSKQTMNNLTTSITTNLHTFQSQTGTTKLIGVTAPMQQTISTAQRNYNIQQNNIIIGGSQANNSTTNGVVVSVSPLTTTIPQTSNVQTVSSAATIATQQNVTAENILKVNSHQITPSINIATPQPAAPRVQTIHLTPQQQQLLKTVQLQIQQLSSKLQNKNLLSTLNIPPDFDPTNPIYNKPLPPLNNIQNMSDTDIHLALQLLFIEQQKILALGKVIPTIPAQQSQSFVPSSFSTTNLTQTVAPITLQNQTIYTQSAANNKTTTLTTNQIKPPVTTANIVPTKNHNQPNNNAQRAQVCPMQHQIQSHQVLKQISTSLISPTSSYQSKILTTNDGNKMTQQTVVQSSQIPPSHTQQQLQTKQCQLQQQQEQQKQQPQNLKLITSTVQIQNSATGENQSLQRNKKIENIETTKAKDIQSSMPLLPTSLPPSVSTAKPTIPRHFLFERQVKVDQESCTNPDYMTPFQNKEEAVKRLIRYHCMYQHDEADNSDEEEHFEKVAVGLQNKFQTILNKFQYLQLQESMRLHNTSELNLINRFLVSDIQKELVQIKSDINTNSNYQNNGNSFNKSMKKTQSSSDYSYPQKICTNYQNIQYSNNRPSINNHSQTTNNSKFQVENNFNIKNEIKSEPSDGFLNKNEPSFSKINETNVAPPTFVSNLNLTINEQNSNINFNENYLITNMIIKDEKKENILFKKTPTLQTNLLSDISKSEQINSTGVKKELDSFGISSGKEKLINTTDTPSNTRDTATTDYPLDYFVNITSNETRVTTTKNTLPTSLPFSENIDVMKKRDDNEINNKNEPYDEWLCIQKELSFMSEKKSDINLTLNHHSRNTNTNTHNPNLNDKTIDKQFSEIFETATQKNNNHHLNELFNNSPAENHNNCSKTEQHHLTTNSIPLNELFNHDNSVNEKSVENRLESMFGESPVQKSERDTVESHLEELFHETTNDNNSGLNTNTIGINSSYHITSNENKRSWNNDNNELISPNATSSPMYSKRSCMLNSYIDETHVTSHHPRWMIEQQYDYIPQNNHHHQQPTNDTASDIDEVRKRPWAGDIISNSIENLPNKKICFSNKHNTELDNEFLGLDTTVHNETLANEIMRHAIQQHNISMSGNINIQENNSHHTNLAQMQANVLMQMQSANIHHHHHHHHNHHIPTNNIVGSTSNSNIFDNSLNSHSINANLSANSSATGSLSSNFDEDINRHVQNAIDSILNLQNSESDSLSFSLDHSMGSFLADSPLDQGHNSCVAGSIIQTSNAGSYVTMGKIRGPHERIDGLNDCLINGSSSATIVNTSNGSMMGDSPTSVMSNTTSSGITDFSCIASIEDAVKSIITS